MERLIFSPQTEMFSGERDFLKGRPKFPNGVSERKMCLPFAIRNQFQAIRQFLSASRGIRQNGCCSKLCFPVAGIALLSKNFEMAIWTHRSYNTAPQPPKNNQFSSDLYSWKLQWLILSGILHLPRNREVIPRGIYNLVQNDDLCRHFEHVKLVLGSFGKLSTLFKWYTPTANGNFQMGILFSICRNHRPTGFPM